MEAKRTLSWSLVVATYQREKILPLCIKLAVEQTRKPAEIIVVDASNNWEQTRNHVMTEIAPTCSDIRWVYVCAEHLSLTLQRNQGLQIATADVVFLIDDDSLMYPTCAEEIMRVYEADPDGVVKGVQAQLANTPPSDQATNEVKKKTGWSEEKHASFNLFQQFLWKHLFLMNAELLCIPYNGDFPHHQIPAAVAKLNVYPVKLFHGCRMSFRREAILQEMFEPLLRYYAILEDMDASYRVSRQGLLVEAVNAQIHHFHSGSGRISRFKVSVLSALNQALLLRKYSDNYQRDRQRFYILMIRRIIAEVLKDALSRRWSLPQARGLLTAWKYADQVFALPDNNLAEWYPNFQRKLLVSDS